MKDSNIKFNSDLFEEVVRDRFLQKETGEGFEITVGKMYGGTLKVVFKPNTPYECDAVIIDGQTLAYETGLSMCVDVIHNPVDGVHNGGAEGLVHLDKKFKDAHFHPDITKHRPLSTWGEPFLAKFHENEYFTWVRMNHDGSFTSTNPVFKIVFR